MIKKYSKIISKILTLVILCFSVLCFSDVLTYAEADIFQYGECIDNADSTYTQCWRSCPQPPSPSNPYCRRECGDAYSSSVLACRNVADPYHRDYTRCTESSTHIYRMCMEGNYECPKLEGNELENCCGQVRTDEFLACYYP